ncbi:MAG: hypothetical protein IPM26_07660 [Saprospiraceae bacterium]|nr:hypothetical protein [Saprospiraceae bacterium]
MKVFLYILMPLMMLTSCTKPDEAILPLVGIFRLISSGGRSGGYSRKY